MKKLVFLILVLLSVQISTAQKVNLPSLISDHMVLQQNSEVALWGWADPGEMIRLSNNWDDEIYYGHTDISGKWILYISTPTAGGPYEIKINEKELSDILIGEVWIASGQSNMQWALQQSENFKDELLNANDPDLRLFYVSRETADEPKKDVYGSWSACDSTVAKTFSAVAYYFGKRLRAELNIPIGIIHVSWGGSTIQGWMSPKALKTLESGQYYQEKFEQAIANVKPGTLPRNHRTPSGLYNGMLKPIIPFGIKGAIWYQGESNRDRPDFYSELFASMLNSWRCEWDRGDFPLYYVQLAPFNYNEVDMGAYVRDVQRRSLDVPNTGMAVTMDIGNVNNIHPTNKLDVGNRLAYWALAKDYGKDLVYSGPLYEKIEIDENKAILHFSSIGSGLMSKGKLSTFEIAGTDQVFYQAKAKINGDLIVVRSSKVKKPVAVRYAFRNTDEASLFNKEGLPAASFRTDNWKIEISR